MYYIYAECGMIFVMILTFSMIKKRKNKTCMASIQNRVQLSSTSLSTLFAAKYRGKINN